MYNPSSPNDSLWSHWILNEIELKNQDWKGYTKYLIFVWSRIPKFLRPALDWDDLKLIKITCQTAWYGKTKHGIFVEFEKLSNTAVVLIFCVTISGTPCPRHITVPFGAEALPGHVARASAIPPPSRGLLSQWHRQQTTTPKTNETYTARTQSHSYEISRLIWRQITLLWEKGAWIIMHVWTKKWNFCMVPYL